MKVLMTSTQLPLLDEDIAPLVRAGAEIRYVDGRDRAALLRAAPDADALLVLAEQIDAEMIGLLGRCRSITRLGVGVDTVDLAAAADHGIWVTNVPDANYREVAVHAIALALAVSRRLPQLDRGVRRDGWTPSIAPGVHRPDQQTFGMIGLGRIGRRTAEVARSIGYRVIAHDPVITAEAVADIGVEILTQEQVIAQADILSLHVPLLESTRHLLDTAAIATMRPGAIVVNVSRGGLIDEHALAAALADGHLFGAGLDAFEHEPLESDSPLRDLDNVVLTPHSGHWSEESWTETKRKAVEDMLRVHQGEQPRYPVNQPSAVLTSGPRRST
jgi:D-3-phosphoglycerate dehydrogenase